MSKTITSEDLDLVVRAGCQEPGCAHPHQDALDLAPACHPKTGVAVSYRLGSGLLDIVCFKCRRVVLSNIAVVSRSMPVTRS